MSTDNKKFSIGQVVYVLSNKNQVIIPVMVVEEVTVQTLNGKKVSWKFAVGSDTKQTIVDSKQLEGDIYASLEEIKTLLTERLSKYIEGVVSRAINNEEAWYGNQLRKAKQEGIVTQNNQKIDPASLLDDVTLSNNDQNFMPQIVKEIDKESQKRKMREMLAADEEEDDPSNPAVTTVIENGVKVRVHLPE